MQGCLTEDKGALLGESGIVIGSSGTRPCSQRHPRRIHTTYQRRRKGGGTSMEEPLDHSEMLSPSFKEHTNVQLVNGGRFDRENSINT